jgi:hypothetical protein
MTLVKLSVKSLYPLVKTIPSVNKFFPDYQPNKLPDRDYFFKVIMFIFNEVCEDCRHKDAHVARGVNSTRLKNSIRYNQSSRVP